MFDLLVAAIIATGQPALAPADTTTVVIEEDSVDPITGRTFWDCRRDGNRVCGPGAVLPDGSLATPGDYSDDVTAEIS